MDIYILIIILAVLADIFNREKRQFISQFISQSVYQSQITVIIMLIRFNCTTIQSFEKKIVY